MTLETMQLIVAELAKRNIAATVEYPGWINVSIGSHGSLACGDVNETISVDLHDANGAHVESIGSDLRNDTSDVQAVADFIASAFTQALELK
jgi:hypothetical protein